LKEKQVLLLSASIKPFNASTQGRFNVEDREQDYFKAVGFYLAKGYRVVLVDNCGYRSEKIQSSYLANTQFEYLVFETKRSHLGKSQGEVEIIDYALIHSRLLNEVEYLIKITGRYIIRNIDQILTPTHGVEKEVYINPTRNLKWADTRLMVMRKSYYHNYFRVAVDRYLDESQKVYMENTFMRSLHLFLLDGGDFSLWPAYPAYDAYDGTHNDKISFSFLKLMKYNIYYKFKKFSFKHRV